MTLLLIFFFVSLCASFLCSVLEAVLLSITPSYVGTTLESEPELGRRLEALKEDIDRPLGAILTLNTIAHTVGAVGVGAQASQVFDPTWRFLGIGSESIVAVVMTLAILVLSEIIPKTLGANYWRQLAPLSVRVIGVMIKVLGPFVWLSQLITRSLKREEVGSVYSRADFVAMASTGQAEGVLQKHESQIMTNLLRMDQLTVEDIMTPRAVMRACEETLTARQWYEQFMSSSFSRIPVYQGRTDMISGFVLKGELLECLVRGEDDKTLASLKRPMPFVRMELELPALLDVFTTKKSHLAICTDQFGTVVGLVTMEDLFETLLGLEILDESDREPDLQALARRQWEERARAQGLM